MLLIFSLKKDPMRGDLATGDARSYGISSHTIVKNALINSFGKHYIRIKYLNEALI